MDLQTLLDERGIYRQLNRFARAMDRRDWTTLAAIAATDIEADLGTGPLSGSEAVIDLIRQYLDNCGTTQHLIGNVMIEVNGEEASSEAYVCDLHLASDDNPDLQFRTLGNYRDRWLRINGDWRLTARHKDNRAIAGSMAVFDV